MVAAMLMVAAVLMVEAVLRVVGSLSAGIQATFVVISVLLIVFERVFYSRHGLVQLQLILNNENMQ